MKTITLIIFFSIVLVVYGAVNTYIFVRGLQAIPSGSHCRGWFSVLFWFIASTFILARVLERVHPSHLTAVFTWIGSFWLGFMLFFFLAVVIIDLARVLNSLLHFLPSSWYSDPGQTKLVILWIVLGLSVLYIVTGFLNARIPRIRELDLTISKPHARPGEMTVVMASDIHLGTIIASRKANRLVKKINAMHPDLVLFAGDIVDEDLAPVINYNLGEALCRIQSRLGVYAITGNHEYIGGVASAVHYLEDHGIRMLRDTAVLVDEQLYLVGRDDRDKSRFIGQPRKELEEIMVSVDTTYPVIVLDHQPFNLAKHATMGIDLQLSGHTHHGQLWPFNFITDAIYELSWGYKKIGNTHFYVSCGYGTWGPPLRLGNQPEVVKINLRFTE
ncbi:MAG: metallophosphoesterase [Bacteroidetes bacterium]|nr:MAG: metallophosphoesterase [Bacteroidota bacterium]